VPEGTAVVDALRLVLDRIKSDVFVLIGGDVVTEVRDTLEAPCPLPSGAPAWLAALPGLPA
jgi:hypothetical protein